MKKTKLTVIVVAILATLSMLFSCGSQSSLQTLSDILDSKADYTEHYYTESAKIALLDGAEYKRYEENIMYFTAEHVDGANTYEKHLIYDAEADAVITTLTESATTDISVSLDSCRVNGNYEPFFYVTTTSWTLNGDGDPDVYSYATALYDASGNLVAETDFTAHPQTFCDLILFDEKMYSLEDGAITYAFDCPSYVSLPYVEQKFDGKYYSLNQGDYVAVYDDELNLISRYNLPLYLDEDFTVFVLASGDIFVQYYAEADFFSSDYSFLTNDSTKYDLTTLIIDKDTGCAEEIACDYLLMYGYSVDNDAEFFESNGFKSGKVSTLAIGFKIENGRLPDIDDLDFDLASTVAIDASGKISDFSKINGESVQNTYFVAENRWIAVTRENAYLINGSGKILGNISNVNGKPGTFFMSDGKVYDCDLNMLFDFGAQELNYYGNVDSSIIFKNDDGEVFLYTGGESAATIVAKDSDLSLCYSSSDSSYYAIKDTSDESQTKYKIYNSKGTLLLAVDENDYMGGYYFGNDFRKCGDFDSFTILRSVDENGKPVYHRLK